MVFMTAKYTKISEVNINVVVVSNLSNAMSTMLASSV